MPEVFYVFEPEGVRLRAARPLPRVLDEWLDWLAAAGGGHAEQMFTRLMADWMDDFWTDNGSDLSEFFTFFLVLGEGSRVGVWHGTNAPVDDHPVVLVGSEGELEVLGSTVTHFLARLAGDDDLDLPDLPEPPGLEPFRSHLRSWLGRTTVEGLCATEPDPPSAALEAWFAERSEEARSAAAADPVLGEIHTALESAIDRARLGDLQPWESVQFVARCVARHFELRVGLEPAEPELCRRIEGPAREYRRQRAASVPGRGGWFTAHFRRHPGSWATPACFFEYRPTFAEVVVTADDYRQDLAEFPRSARWTPDWLWSG